MILYPYLIINSKGSVKISKKAPTVKGDEIAIRLNINIPNAIFNKPKLQASITIPESALVPEVIGQEVIKSIQENVKMQAGVDLKITVDEPKR